MEIQLRNKYGAYKDAKIGVSWTALLFGFLTPLFRGDYKWAAIMFVANSITWTFSRWVFLFLYNKKYIEDLINQGYLPANERSQDYMLRNGFYFDEVDFSEEVLDKEKEIA